MKERWVMTQLIKHVGNLLTLATTRAKSLLALAIKPGESLFTLMMNSLRIVAGVYLAILFVEAVILSGVQHWGLYDSFWFVRVTALTIGYGDLSPHSVVGRVVVIGFAHLLILTITPIIVANLIAKGIWNKDQWTGAEQDCTLGSIASIGARLGVELSPPPTGVHHSNLSRLVLRRHNKITRLLIHMMSNWKIMVAIYGVSLLATSVVLSVIENWSFVSSFWFSIVTALTIGYGDLAPHTILGREVTLLFAYFCILVLTPAIVAHCLRYVFRLMDEWTHPRQEWLIHAVVAINRQLGGDAIEEPPDTDLGDVS